MPTYVSLFVWRSGGEQGTITNRLERVLGSPEMAITSNRLVQMGDRQIPVVLPNTRDPRLHTASVIISVHVIGITALGFRVSVPQILSAILTAAAIDVFLTYRSTGKLVWPASGMLTGSGVALILRLVGMESGNYWSWEGWYLFSAIAGISLLTKHFIRFGGTHVFNPSNVGLVAAFLLLGSSVVEPLDFWWAPMGFWMGLGYLVIIVGGFLITRRLRLLEMAVGYWVAFAGGLAVLAASGHCMTAAWSVDPVCGSRFWSVLITSPEVLVFMFFMITDPKTVPSGRLARLVFALTLGLATTLLMAPQTVEFGTKVALLGSLVLWSPIRGAFDRMLPDANPNRPAIAELLDRSTGAGRRAAKVFVSGLAVGSFVVVLTVVIVLAGAPARAPIDSGSLPSGAVIAADIDPAGLPEVVVGPGMEAVNIDVDEEFSRSLAVNLAENLWIEGEAIRRGDGSLLAGGVASDRLAEMQRRVDDAITIGERVVHEYRFETLTLGVAETGGDQLGAAMSLEGSGILDLVTYDAFGVEQERSESAFASTFVLRQLGGDRWLLVGVR
ncbi:hypothetical protein BH23ACT4_BH23ACT4_13600 [soil metagenome]